VKILHTIGSIAANTGGPARSSQGLVAALQGHNVGAWLFSFTPGEVTWVKGVTQFRALNELRYSSSPAESSGANGGSISRSMNLIKRAVLPKIYAHLGRMQKEFEDYVDEVKPDIIHVHAIWGCAAHVACRTARRKNLPYIVAPRGMLEPWSLQQKKLKKLLAMWLYQGKDLQRATALHATAESEAEQFRKLGFTQPIIVSPNGVEFPENMPPRVFRSDGKKTALFLSRIHPKKGLIELVEAWAEVKRQLAVEGQRSEDATLVTNELMNYRTNELFNWHVEYAGPDYDGHLTQVQNRIRELGVEDDFTYLGSLGDNEKWTAYRRADVFVLPTYSENFGIVVAEALYAGIPVITTKGAPWAGLLGVLESSSRNAENRCQSATNELEASGRCGWWIDVGVGPLVQALLEVTTLSDDERLTMGENGRRLVESNYTWPAIAKKMAEAYEVLMKD
jgi:glycosyltransferase involved in cell wall biosynthesis